MRPVTSAVSEHFKRISELCINAAGFSARACSSYSFDRRRQLIVRRRVWNIEGQGEVEDYCEYRLFFPAELEWLLSECNFKVVGMFDNRELCESDLSGPRLYVAAIFRPELGQKLFTLTP